MEHYCNFDLKDMKHHLESTNFQILSDTFLITHLTKKGFGRLLTEHNLSHAQHELLCKIYFCPKPNVQLTDLSREMLVSKATVSGLVKRLKEKGLLYLEDNLDDRRSQFLRLTDEGMNAVRHSLEIFAKESDDLLGEVTDEDKATTLKVLHVIINKLIETN